MEMVYDYSTKNKSFLEINFILKNEGISNNAFHLALNNLKLQGVDPYDEDLTPDQKLMILKECHDNIFYFLREVARVRIDEFLLSALYNFCINADFCLFTNVNYNRKKYYSCIANMLVWVFLFSNPITRILNFESENDNGFRYNMLNEMKQLPSYIKNKDKYSHHAPPNIFINAINYNSVTTKMISNPSNEMIETYARSLIGEYQVFNNIVNSNFMESFLKWSTMPYKMQTVNAEQNGSGHCRIIMINSHEKHNKSISSLLDLSLPWKNTYYDMDVTKYKESKIGFVLIN